jgi:N-carbamoyl-L-amino-acid hydrolase
VTIPSSVRDTAFASAWASLLPIGLEAGGGYRRLAWSDADLACREWFRAQAQARDLILDEDGNGNQWAWWGEPGEGAIVTGSHLDSVPGGGAFDGPLGVVSGFVAVDVLRERGVTPTRPVAVTNFTDEEGGRFGIACIGSRLMSGDASPESLLARADEAGLTMGDARRRGGLLPEAAGPDPERLGRIATFVELHIEQGRRLIDLDVAVGVATAVWPHGRWRIDFAGRGDHAGTTRLADRRDPVLPLAETILAARRAAHDHDALATVGRLAVVPGATNAIASHATAWLDARAPGPDTVRRVVEAVGGAASKAGAEHGVAVEVAEESWSGGADFGAGLRNRLAATVKERLGTVAVLPTGAGHDAAILAAHVPSAMLFVRNPSGISHDPAEHATTSDCLAGVDALAAVLEDLIREAPASQASAS